MGGKKKNKMKNSAAAKAASAELQQEKQQIEVEKNEKGGKQPKNQDRATKEQFRKQRQRFTYGVRPILQPILWIDLIRLISS
jgi:hypothetical protein